MSALPQKCADPEDAAPAILAAMRIALLTTSYPRFPGDFAGRFIEDAVQQLTELGFAISVVGPGSYRDFGLTYGRGVVHNALRRPWAVPPLLASMVRATRAAARDADLVHAYWLPSGAVAMASGRPFVLTLLGTDVALARKTPWLARPILRRARAVICISHDLAHAARRMGAPDPIVIPVGVEMPQTTTTPGEPPSVLYAGRLSAEKGIAELAEATKGMRTVIAGDGPLRSLVPETLGFVSGEELSGLYERAAIIVCPSHREGFGIACAEAMAHARPVVASAVGGFLDLVAHGETGYLVPPRDAAALRASLEELLADRALRERLGRAGRERILRMCSRQRVAGLTAQVYERALEQQLVRPRDLTAVD